MQAYVRKQYFLYINNMDGYFILINLKGIFFQDQMNN